MPDYRLVHQNINLSDYQSPARAPNLREALLTRLEEKPRRQRRSLLHPCRLEWKDGSAGKIEGRTGLRSRKLRQWYYLGSNSKFPQREDPFQSQKGDGCRSCTPSIGWSLGATKPSVAPTAPLAQSLGALLLPVSSKHITSLKITLLTLGGHQLTNGIFQAALCRDTLIICS